ncbi:hypothetical protein AGMMS50256_36150 [Betaproteobacteria bacterium]|nr:hypothetical protein AGMMS50256_36150 [Betaproteobacteria bacterium]
MTTHAQTEQWGYRLGRGAGHAGGWLARADRKANGYLVAQGMNANLARGILQAIEFVLLAILLYGAFWVGLLLLFAVTGAWLLRNDDGSYDEEHKPEWRYGHQGFGLYDKNEWRYDMGDDEGP